MSQPTGHQPSPTRRPRSARGTKPGAGKRVAATDDKAAAQPMGSAEAPSPSPPSELPGGEKWGEFPSVEHQNELRVMLEKWEQEPDHGNRPGPFAQVHLSGASVYWLAALAAGAGDVGEGKKALLAKYRYVGLSSLHLEGATLNGAHLEGATLNEAHLEGASLNEARLESAKLKNAHLEGTDLRRAHLERSSLNGAHLERSSLYEAHLENADLNGVRLEGANLSRAHLEDADLRGAHLEGVWLNEAHLERTSLYGAHLKNADLNRAHLEGANLSRAHLEGASLNRAHLEGASLNKAVLTNQVNLREATFDATTNLAEIHLDATLLAADVLWNGVPLIRADWRQMPRLGDEAVARQAHLSNGEHKDKGERLRGFEAAARAYRQLAVALRGQGITEAADRFTYRALIMQRKALWWQLRNKQLSTLGPYLFSLFLAVLTGYGFRMWRIIAAYALLILTFAGAYWSLDLQTPHIYSFWQALILSVTAFHGRVFSNPFLLTEPQIVVTAIEAIFGLVIEGVFIAMLTQRFFTR